MHLFRLQQTVVNFLKGKGKKVLLSVKVSEKSKSLFSDVTVADDFFSRFVGLMGRKSMRANQCFIIAPCSSVHTIGMKFSIDVIFVDTNKVIVKMVKELKPFRMASANKAKYTIEVAAGMAQQKNLKLGDQLSW